MQKNISGRARANRAGLITDKNRSLNLLGLDKSSRNSQIKKKKGKLRVTHEHLRTSSIADIAFAICKYYITIPGEIFSTCFIGGIS